MDRMDDSGETRQEGAQASLFAALPQALGDPTRP